MPKRGRKFIWKFLVPNLDTGKFGNRLAWVDKNESTFQIQWNHKGASDWTEKDAAVFIEWDKMQGRYKPSEEHYFSTAKARFRAVLYKMIREKQIKNLSSRDKCVKYFCLDFQTDSSDSTGIGYNSMEISEHLAQMDENPIEISGHVLEENLIGIDENLKNNVDPVSMESAFIQHDQRVTGGTSDKTFDGLVSLDDTATFYQPSTPEKNYPPLDSVFHLDDKIQLEIEDYHEYNNDSYSQPEFEKWMSVL